MKLDKNPLIRFLSSYGLGLIVLLFMMLLLILGTLYQAEHGLYRAQQRFYDSYLIAMPIAQTGFAIPLPGARLLVVVLFINIVCASIFRMRPSRRTIGVYIVHLGILILLGGGFLTAYAASEGYMRIAEGESANFSTRFHHEELAIIRQDSPNEETVTVVRHLERVRPGALIHRATDDFPFDIDLVRFFPETEARLDESGEFAKEFGVNDSFSRQVKLIPVGPGPSDAKLAGGVFRFRQAGQPDLVATLADSIDHDLTLTAGGKTYQVRFRDRRDYYPFSIYLRDFQRETYPGTRINRAFTSLVTLVIPEETVERRVRIYMNHPLRYRNYTFYQASFDRGDTESILQVVYNPGLPFPYVSAIVVAIGLIVQFAYVLVSRAELRRRLVGDLSH